MITIAQILRILDSYEERNLTTINFDLIRHLLHEEADAVQEMTKPTPVKFDPLMGEFYDQDTGDYI